MKINYSVTEDIPESSVFNYPIGIELTFIHKNWVSARRSAKKLYKDISIIEDILEDNNIPYDSIHVDDGCIEIPSKILKDYINAEKYYKTITSIVRKFGYYPHHKNHASGGGHIHVGNIPKKVTLQIFKDMFCRPYVNWAFNDSEDNYTTSLHDVGYDFFQKLIEENNFPLDGLPSAKEFMIEYREEYSTVEFRMFQAPNNWQEQKEHIDFVQAYVEYISFNLGWGLKQISVKSCFNYNNCKKSFIHLISNIGLNTKKYVKYCKRNMNNRFLLDRDYPNSGFLV